MTALVAAGWMGLSLSNLHAAFVNTNCFVVEFSLTAVLAGNVTTTTNSKGTITTVTAQKEKIISKDILNLLHAEFEGPVFPAGARLVFNNHSGPGGTGFAVADKNGDVILNVSSNLVDSSYLFYLTNLLAPTTLVTGKFFENTTNFNTISTETTYFSDQTIFYKDAAGNDFHVSGMATAKIIMLQTPMGGTYKMATLVIPVSGAGKILNLSDGHYDDAVLTGTVKFTGKNIFL
jgi:hypothetical protein